MTMNLQWWHRKKSITIKNKKYILVPSIVMLLPLACILISEYYRSALKKHWKQNKDELRWRVKLNWCFRFFRPHLLKICKQKTLQSNAFAELNLFQVAFSLDIIFWKWFGNYRRRCWAKVAETSHDRSLDLSSGPKKLRTSALHIHAIKLPIQHLIGALLIRIVSTGTGKMRYMG